MLAYLGNNGHYSIYVENIITATFLDSRKSATVYNNICRPFTYNNSKYAEVVVPWDVNKYDLPIY